MNTVQQGTRQLSSRNWREKTETADRPQPSTETAQEAEQDHAGGVTKIARRAT